MLVVYNHSAMLAPTLLICVFIIVLCLVTVFTVYWQELMTMEISDWSYNDTTVTWQENTESTHNVTVASIFSRK